MKKYVNGKIVDMTEEDIAKRRARISGKPQKDISEYENRIKELENTIAKLIANSEEIDTEEVKSEEPESEAAEQ